MRTENGSDEPLEFKVAPNDPRERADRLVTHLLTRAGFATTRAEVQRWMADGRVLIDGQPARRARSVPAAAVVTVRPAGPPPSDAAPDPSVPFHVVYEDEHLLVVDKPAGLVVHPARGHREGTLVQGLLAHRQQADLIQRAGAGGPGEDEEATASDAADLPADPRDPAGHERPGIVHRLDKGTSGLLVVAKTAAVREALKALFSQHDIQRHYLAIVVGRARRACYDTPYGRHPRSRLRFTSTLAADKNGVRRAITHVEPEELLAGASVVRCWLQTGRTHQIRVHLAEQARTPVLGDPLYGPKPSDARIRQVADALGRQALHAATLGFVHPATGDAMQWESSLPRDMLQALAALRA